MPHVVAIFDPEWVCEAAVDTDESALPVQYFTAAAQEPLERLVSALRGRAADSLQPEKDESGCVTGFVQKTFGQEGYAAAVADECKRAGFRAAVVAKDVLPLIRTVPAELRPQVLPEVLYMEPDLAREVLTRMAS